MHFSPGCHGHTSAHHTVGLLMCPCLASALRLGLVCDSQPGVQYRWLADVNALLMLLTSRPTVLVSLGSACQASCTVLGFCNTSAFVAMLLTALESMRAKGHQDHRVAAASTACVDK